MTKIDNSVLGRERAMFNAFFDFKKGRGEKWRFAFARQTLLGRIVGLFKPDDSYCFLDGFTFDQFKHTSSAFTGVGRFWMLPEPGTPGDIAVIISVQFDLAKQNIEGALIWIGPIVPPRHIAPKVECVEPWLMLGNKCDPGPEWQLAFRKDQNGWHINPDFDLSVLLMPWAE